MILCISVVSVVILYLNSQDKGMLMSTVKETRNNQAKDTEKEHLVM